MFWSAIARSAIRCDWIAAKKRIDMPLVYTSGLRIGTVRTGGCFGFVIYCMLCSAASVTKLMKQVIHFYIHVSVNVL